MRDLPGAVTTLLTGVAPYGTEWYRMGRRQQPGVVDVHARLMREDVAALKALAAQTGISWQMELRQLVHRALKGEQRSVLVLKESP